MLELRQQFRHRRRQRGVGKIGAWQPQRARLVAATSQARNRESRNAERESEVREGVIERRQILRRAERVDAKLMTSDVGRIVVFANFG